MTEISYTYKVVVVGDINVGKTSIIKTFLYNIFSNSYKSTIGVDFGLKRLYPNENTVINLQLWDIAGQERFGNMTRIYYKEAVAAIIVFDLTKENTFDNVVKWKMDIDTKIFLYNDKPIPVILLGNKSDLQTEQFMTDEEMKDYCKNNGFIGYYKVSAKNGNDIETAMNYLIDEIQNNKFIMNNLEIEDVVTGITLSSENTKEESNGCYC